MIPGRRPIVWEKEIHPMLIYYMQMLDTPEEKLRFEQIYQEYRGLMYHVADNVLHNCQDAEDAVHNAFLQVIKHFVRLRSASSRDLVPQLVVIARNEAISILRKKQDTAPLEDQDGIAGASAAGAGYQALVDSFTRLPQTYRSVMEMKLLSGYSDGEIAAKLGLSKTAVSTRISRGRQLLRDIVEQEGFLMEA